MLSFVLERVDDFKAINDLAVMQVFGKEYIAFSYKRSSDDGAVPIGEAMAGGDIKGCSENVDRQVPDLEARPRLYQLHRPVMIDAARAIYPCCLDIEFLHHLYRENAIRALKNPFGRMSLENVVLISEFCV